MHTFLFPIPATMQAFSLIFVLDYPPQIFIYTQMQTLSLPYDRYVKIHTPQNSIHVYMNPTQVKKVKPSSCLQINRKNKRNTIIRNALDLLRMGTVVLDRNNLVFKQNLEIIFVPYYRYEHFHGKFQKIVVSDISNSRFLIDFNLKKKPTCKCLL